MTEFAKLFWEIFIVTLTLNLNLKVFAKESLSVWRVKLKEATSPTSDRMWKAKLTTFISYDSY